jgi:hypothetical protein
MPHVLASQQAASSPNGEAARSAAPAEPTVREPALERKREREERLVGGQTLNLGSGLPPEVSTGSHDLPATSGATPPALPQSTQRFGTGGTLDMRAGAAPAASAALTALRGQEADKPSPARGRVEPTHEALHDDFFDAGEQGLYEGGPAPEGRHQVLDDELEHDAPRIVVRTPEQEMRRNRMMRVVGVVVGVVLGVLVFAVVRGRGTSGDDAKTRGEHPVTEPQPVEPQAPAVVAPPPAPPPPPEPAVVAPPEPAAPPPEAAAPDEKPAEKPPAEKPVPAPRVEGAAPAPRPRPAGGDATPPVKPAQPRPAGPVPPAIPAGKPPTVSFPD